MHDFCEILEDDGSVIGGFPFAALLPLVASALGPVLNKVLGNGAKHIRVKHGGKVHHHKLRKTKETKKGGAAFTESESYLVPHIHSVHGTGHRGGAVGFGAHGGASSWQGYSADTPVQYGEVAYPLGGAAGFGAVGFGAAGFGAKKKKGHGAVGFGKKKGGYAVDQMHSNAYTGFVPGHDQAMFPVNRA